MNFAENQNQERETYFNELENATKNQVDLVSDELQIETAETRNEHLDSLFVEWLAPSIHHHHVDHRWRATVIIILLGMAGLSIFWQQSFLGAIMFIGIALVASMHFHQEPEHMNVGIHPAGVSINDHTFSYQNIESFWVRYEPGHIKELSLRCKNLLHQHVKIPLGDEDPNKIRAQLAKYIPEEIHEETFSDFLGRKLGL
ncbi:MAG: hypothetical protein HYW77_00805 [Parcubacteria group bacterium]|nr:hypothetical protein [Parcubacteria group bacterium]